MSIPRACLLAPAVIVAAACVWTVLDNWLRDRRTA